MGISDILFVIPQLRESWFHLDINISSPIFASMQCSLQFTSIILWKNGNCLLPITQNALRYIFILYIIMVYCFVLNSHTLRSLGNTVVKKGFGEWRYLLLFNTSREVACPLWLFESILQVLMLRCKKQRVSILRKETETPWTNKKEASGNWSGCWPFVPGGSSDSVGKGEAQVHKCESHCVNPYELTLRALLLGRVFAVRYESRHRAPGLEWPKCWTEVGISFESCQCMYLPFTSLHQ